MVSSHSHTDWKKWRFISGVYLLTTLVFALQRIIFDLQHGKPEDILTSLLDLSAFAGIWIALTVPIIRMTTGRRLTTLNLLALAAAGILLSLFHAAAYLIFSMMLPGLILDPTITSVADYFTTFAGLSHAWRFLSFGFILVLSFAYDFYFLAIERERRSAQLQVQLTEAKLNALKMQLQPHFLFNTLNAISVLIDDNPPAARETLAQLSDLLRLTLENSQSQEVTLRREMEFLDRYLRIQQTRYEDRLIVRKNIDPDSLAASVPCMILQPVVENSLKHGIDTVPGTGTITISALRRNGSLVLQVDDTGPGIGTASSRGTGRGLGLANTQTRLQELYGDRHRFVIEDSLDTHGTRVTIEIPFESASQPPDPHGKDPV